MTDPLDVLAIFAHPDDSELLAGGTLIRSVDRGERVGILDLTRGEKGTRGSAEIREREAQEAAEALGVALRMNAGFVDAGLEANHESRVRLVGLIRELRPRVVVTHWMEGRHPDHHVAARLVRDASFLSGLRNFPAPGEAFRPMKVVHAVAYREDAPEPSFIVDITDQMDRKVEAISCYTSQFRGVAGGGELYPGGERPLTVQVRMHAAYWGSRIRTGYGEPFWTQEALQVDTLGSLGVSTF
jgi:bacillithiol biosynthesis deacetylase BshB1